MKKSNIRQVGGVISSKSSRAPYEYVDASGGIHPNGVFDITKAYYLTA